MLKLTKTGIGLLTRQYRSVLKKCWAINVGVFAIFTSSANALIRLFTSEQIAYQQISASQIYYLSSSESDANSGAVYSWDEVNSLLAGKQAALSSTQLAAANSGITAAKVSTYDGYSTTIEGKADKATTLLGYGITDAYTKTEVDNLISQAGGSSVDLSDYYTKSEIYNKTEIENIQSLNNYYRKNEKLGILNGVKEGKIGNENDDNFSKFRADNDNFVTKNGDFVLNNDSFLTNNGDFVLKNGDFSLKNLSRLGAFAKCGKACPRPSERFPASLEKNSVFEQYSRSARGTFLFVSQTHKNVLDNFSKLTANDNFAATTFLRAI